MSDHKYSNLAEAVSHLMKDVSRVESVDDGIRVTTHCLYPSNGLVRVIVRGGNDSVMISDDGGALSEAASAGIQSPFTDQFITSQVRSQGLKVSGGAIYSPRVPLNAAAMGILLVANASKEVAQWYYDHAKIKRDRDFKKLLSEFLYRKF